MSSNHHYYCEIPIVIGNILQQLYTTVDTLVVGSFCGDRSLAAVGTSSQPVEVLLCIFLGIGSGVSILISQSIGAGDEKKVKEIAKAATAFVYMSGIPIAVIGFLAAPYILRFMGVPKDVWDAALIYTRIVLLAAIGNIGYNMNAGILRGLGDSVASLWFLVVSCISNIALDLLLVAALISQWCYAVFNCISNIVNGVGFVKYTTAINLLMLWAVRIPCAYLINRYYDGTWIMFCFPVSFAFGMICMIGYYIFSPSFKKIIMTEVPAHC